MQENRIKMTLVSFVIVAATLSGCGPEKSTENKPQNTQIPPKISSDQVAPEVQFTNKQFDPHSDVTPSARGCNNKTGFYFAGSFIYWNSSFSDMVISSRLQNPGVYSQKQKKIYLDSQYDPGFKLGAGVNFHRDVWDIFLNWTWLQSDFNETKSTDTPKLSTMLESVVALGDLVGTAEKFKAHWDFDFDTLDLEVGRKFYISKYIAFRPYVGLKAAWINYKLKMSYFNVVDYHGAPYLSAPRSEFKDHMWGIGPRIGLNTRWVLGHCNVGFLANFSGSIIWEDFQPLSKTHFVNPDGTTPAISRITAHEQDLNPVVEVFLGFDWGRCFNQKVYFNIAAGYEMQYWWDQMKASNFFETNPSNALNLHGLTTTVRLEF